MKTTEHTAEDSGNGVVGIGILRDLVGYHLRRASNVFATDFSRSLSGTGMRQVLFGILSVLSANPGIAQGAAGRILGIHRPNMVSLINELVDTGLIERQVSHEDRRVFCLSLTAAGKAAFNRSIEQIRAHEDNLLEAFTLDERQKLIVLLTRIEAAALYVRSDLSKPGPNP